MVYAEINPAVAFTSISSKTMTFITSASFTDTKSHYHLLDGLRGVAALLVVWYHVFEGFSFAAGGTLIKTFNHGYLAVDFFFILSGFVIGYAYDDRWQKGFTIGKFFARRLIRLHPMVILGAVIGTVSFFLGGAAQWDGTHIATSLVMLALLCTLFFVPAVPGASYEVRGNGEMFPLNGPCWSLFFEYIGNILYTLFIRRLSTRNLTLLVGVLGCALAAFAITDVSGYGCLGVGWTIDTVNFFGGLLRMLFPFTIGMLISRKFHPIKIRGAFWICTIVLVALFAVPFIKSNGNICLNGVYESFCIIIAFPILLWLGASGTTTDKLSTSVCDFLGSISYPLYMVHYPIMYLFYAWLIKNKRYTLEETWPMVLCICAASLILAFICLKLYDIPIRKYLARHLLHR